jgi:DNA repair exonuclease SbcCD ATPase subunit
VLFKSVELKNFMSYEAAKFDFESGLTLIDGPNGVGKSSLWDSISWALFGKTVREVGDDGVINRKFGKNCEVRVKIEHKAYRYTVIRYRKHKEFNNRLMIEKRGTITRDIRMVEQGTISATQQWLIDELGIDFDLFRCTVLFGQDESFNFVNESNGEQKKILSKITKVNFTEYQQKAKDQLKETQNRLEEIDRKVSVLKSHLGDPEEKYRDEVIEWDENHVAEIAGLSKELKSLKAKIEEITVPDTTELNIKIDSFKAKKADVQAKIDARTVTSSKIASEISSLQREIKRHETLSEAGKCPTCEKPVESSECQDIISELTQKLDVWKDKQDKLKASLDQLWTAKEQIEERQEKLRDELNESTQASREITHHKENFRHRKVQLEKLKTETNPFMARIETEREEQKKIAAKISTFEVELTKLKAQEPYLEFWVKAFGDDGIKSFIFDIICGSLTAKANSYLNTLTGGQISIAFDTQKKLKSGEVREKFDCQVITDGEAVPYSNYSGGEKTTDKSRG